MSSVEHKQKIWKMIKKIKVAMLTTADGERLRSRPMYLVQDEYDGKLWFFTRVSSAKAHEVEEDHEVCVSFADPDGETYVSLTGRARMIDDPALKDKFWNVFVSAWYPEGKDSADVGLLEVKVDSGEHWDSTSSRLLQTFEMAKANLTHSVPDVGENQKFGAL